MGEAIEQFISISPANGVNNFILEGPLDTPIQFDTYVALLPNQNRKYILATCTYKSKVSVLETYHDIRALTVSDRINALPVFDDASVSGMVERGCIRLGLPSIVMAIGHSVPEEVPVTALYLIHGISPQTGLRLLQDRVHERMVAFN